MAESEKSDFIYVSRVLTAQELEAAEALLIPFAPPEIPLWRRLAHRLGNWLHSL